MIRKKTLTTGPRWLLVLALGLGLGLSITLPAAPAEAGKLKKVRRAVAKGSKGRRSGRRGARGSSYGGGASAAEALLAARILSAPWWLPHLAVGDEFGRRFAYLSHPYQGGADGYIQQVGRDRGRSIGGGRAVLGKSTAVRASVESGFISPELSRFSIGGRISGNHRFEIETKWDAYSEGLGAATQGGVAIDQLWFGDVNLTWQHAVGRHGQFRTGVGVRSMIDTAQGGETAHGVNFTYGFDLYPARPFVVHGSADVGVVGEAAYAQLSGSLGVMLGALELYAGYDQVWVGDNDLGGPKVGLRLWR